jgi:hypothetical protein
MKAMQEQAHYKTTPEQGWSQMKSVLDQEMPIEKQSRRPIFLWWSFAGIALMGLSGMFLLQAKVDSPESNLPAVPHQESPKSTAPIQDNQADDKGAIDKNEFAIKDSNTNGSTVSIDAGKDASETGSMAASESVNIKEEGLSPKNTSTTSSTGSPSTGNVVLIDADHYLVSDEQEANSISEENVLTTTIEAHPEQDFQRANLPVSPIPAMDIAYFTIPESELGAIQANEFTQPAKNGIKINPNIEANVLSGFTGGTGWYAGAGSSLRLSPKFDLTAGLGYRSFSPGASLFPSPSADYAADPSNNTLIKNDTTFEGFYVASESINNASYQDLDPVIESIKQWQAQVGVDWRFSRRFSFETGAGLAFHTRAYSEYPIVPTGYVFNAPPTRVSNSLEEYDVIRKTMASCFVGVTYHIGKHVALKLQWFHTFQPYLSADNNNNVLASFEQRDDFIRGITFGMKYSFL